MIVAFSGFACNGKSTIIKTMKEILKNEDVFVMNETARIVDSIMPYFEKEFEVGNFEKYILYSEISQHEVMFGIKDRYDIILKDRSIFDVLTFMIIRNEINTRDALDFLRENYDNEKHLSNLYDKIFFIRGTKDKDFIECLLEKDKLRRETVSNFFEMQRKFEYMWHRIVSDYQEETNRTLNIEYLDHPKDNSMTMWIIFGRILSERGVK